jgi:hypothetical protein
MSDQDLAKLVGVLISLFLGWLPWLSTWYDKKSSKAKAGIAAGFTVAVSLVIFASSCAGWNLVPGVLCTKEGLGSWALVTANALVFMAGGYVTLVRPFKV